jgi:cysteine desulfurase
MIYLDYAASTPIDARVLAAMWPHFEETYGNPSSVHTAGQHAEHALEQARQAVAEVLGCRPREVLFTSGGSEADNLALRGIALAERARRGANHLVISPVEHEAVAATAHHLRDHFGFELTEVGVDAAGRVQPEALERALRPDTAVAAIVYANNEVGTINDLPALSEVCRHHGVPLHTDAVQAVSQLDVTVDKLGVTSLALGAHKAYGPKGVGALYLRSGQPLLPTQTGGGHEGGLRAGTPNVPLIVGLAEALRLTAAEREAHNRHFAALRQRLIEGVQAAFPDAVLTGHPLERLPNHASFAFPGADGNALVMRLDLAGFAVSSGSACKTGDPRPSSVLLALGLPPALASGSLRVTVGRPTSVEDVDHFLTGLARCLRPRSS